MLVLLISITLFFLMLNYIITKDYMHPSVVFCFMFFVCAMQCLFFSKTFQITLHSESIFVLTIGFSLFTLITMFCKKNKKEIGTVKLQNIEVSNKLILILIILQILTIISFICYLNDIANAYNNYGVINAPFTKKIQLYDWLIKFNVDAFRNLNVSKPYIYRFGFPLVSTFGYIVLYVIVNNFVVSKKVSILQIIVILLMSISIILTGSRTPLFRIITFALILYYILACRNGIFKQGNLKILLKLIVVIAITVFFMLFVMKLMGRGDTMGKSLANYLFVYVGAEIVNLDTFLHSNDISFLSGFSILFGQYTFQPIYTYIGKIFNIPFLYYPTIEIVEKSANGFFVGNVHTTYYPFIYDFGYIGILLICVIAFYYIYSYQNLITRKKTGFDYKLFIFAYLFNDLIMLFFSNRFFEAVSDPFFFKMLFLLVIVRLCCNNKFVKKTIKRF